MAKSILIIEDDATLNKLLSVQINDMGYLTFGATSWDAAEVWLHKNDPDLVLLDRHLPDISGDELLSRLLPNYPVIILTAFANINKAVKAMQAGLADYLVKPVNLDELKVVIDRALQTQTLLERNQYYKEKLNRKKKLLLGNSTALQEVDQLIGVVAPTEITVLIHGESGVGKELVAHELHERSDRADQHFSALDCCTIQEDLFESELFGHEKGAFTSADRKKRGLIEAAGSGTLFLDEIGEISAAVQAKLLRVLETGTYRRVGGTENLVSHARIITATNRNLDEMVAEGSFRKDLYYRLNAFTITMPPLKERRDDIPELVHHFIKNHSFSRKVTKHVNASAMKLLIAYDWPGNVRELKNVVERAIILSQNQTHIKKEHLAFYCVDNLSLSSTQMTFESEPTLDEMEKRYLTELLEKYSGHRGKVSGIMGVSERNIYRLIKKYNLQ